MTPTVIWMRHGTSYDGLHHPDAQPHPDTALSPQGATEAEHAARRLQTIGWRPSLTLVSTQPRALTTANLVATALSTSAPEPLALVREWAAPPCIHGKRADQYPPEYLAWQTIRTAEPDAPPPGGESLTALHRRAAQAHALIDERTSQARPILVVSHRVFIAMVAALATGINHAGEAFEFARTWQLSPAGFWPDPTQGSDADLENLRA